MEMLQNIVLTEIAQPVNVYSAKNRHFEMVDRRSYGLSLCIRGQLTYTQDGVQYVSHPGCAVLLPKGGNYSLRGDQEGIFPVINFQCTGLDCDRITVIPLANPKDLLGELEQLRAAFVPRENRLQAFSVLYEMLGILARTGAASNLLEPVIAFMTEHLSSPELCNRQLAAQLGISEVYFRKLFQRELGIPPRQYLLDMRIRKAKQLLTESELSVTEIAEACGFSSVYHFCRMFRQRCSCTPGDYARNNRILSI